MASQSRQRVIGAVILIALLAIFIPVFLTHPKSHDTQQVAAQPPAPPAAPVVQLTLPPMPKAPAPQSQPAAAPVVPAVPAPAVHPLVAHGQPHSLTVLAAHVTKSTKPITTVSKPAPAKANTWRLQLGSFSSQQNSDRLVAKLKQAGFDATTQTKTTKQGGVVHLVFIGPTGDRKHAEAIQHHLKVALHLPSFIVH